MHDIVLKNAEMLDALLISVLMKTVYIETYALEGITFEFANFINDKFSVQSIQEKIISKASDVIIAYHKGNPVGVSLVLFDSFCPIKKRSIPELSKLYVLDRFKGQGIGKSLLHATENRVLSNGYKNLNIVVYAKNTAAIKFYNNLGYSSIGTVDFVMESNTYLNEVMHKTLA